MPERGSKVHIVKSTARGDAWGRWEHRHVWCGRVFGAIKGSEPDHLTDDPKTCTVEELCQLCNSAYKAKK